MNDLWEVFNVEKYFQFGAGWDIAAAPAYTDLYSLPIRLPYLWSIEYKHYSAVHLDSNSKLQDNLAEQVGTNNSYMCIHAATDQVRNTLIIILMV